MKMNDFSFCARSFGTIRSKWWVLLLLLAPVILFAEDGVGSKTSHLLSSIGISILAATVMAFLSHLTKQPLLLAYIAAGVIIGPNIGFNFVSSKEDISVIAEIGLILLLFMIGLEIDMKKLRESGRALIFSGLFQFVICTLLGFLILPYLPLGSGFGKYGIFYLAVCCALSSTAIVVKLLYGKFELATLAGNITLGVLIFQDIWAIVVLGVQPNLASPDVIKILISFGKGALLVALSLFLSRYVLPIIFKSIARTPELVLVASLGWCFFLCGAASYLDLSVEMGALIAGISISTFPYNLDVISKVISIRDFFVTLFFVALGMQIPNPAQDLDLLKSAFIVSLFLIVTRFFSIYPVLFGLRQGHRVSLLTSINLANLSEFSLVIASLGLAAGHIDQRLLSLIILVFVINSIAAPYLIKYNQPLAFWLGQMLKRFGLKDVEVVKMAVDEKEDHAVALLGFFRVASTFVSEVKSLELATDKQLLDHLLVVDLNPNIHEKLHALGVKSIYGDISHMETLHHAGIHGAKVVISTIPDTMLVGTDNLKIIHQIRKICPEAKIIVTAESTGRALKMYAEGASYVLLSRQLVADHLLEVVRESLDGDLEARSKKEIEVLKLREEILN
jgi:Kef-type K+ transport system membrane component KefB/voltage-gated potassium channel Kch